MAKKKRKKSKKAAGGRPDVLTSVRLPSKLIDRLDELIPVLEDDPSMMAMGTITRSKVIRLALLRGVEALEEDR